MDRLNIDAAVAPAAAVPGPASDLAGLLSEAADAVLAPRTATAFRLRYGLDRGRYRTLAEVGSDLGVTRERARQLTTTAVGRLRRRGRFELARGRPLGPCGLLVAQAEIMVGDLRGAVMPVRVLEQLGDQLRFLSPRVGARLLLTLAGMPWPETAAAAAAVYAVLQRQLRARFEHQQAERTARAQLLRRVRFERFLLDSAIWFGPPQLVRCLGGFQATPQGSTGGRRRLPQPEAGPPGGLRVHLGSRLLPVPGPGRGGLELPGAAGPHPPGHRWPPTPLSP